MVMEYFIPGALAIMAVMVAMYMLRNAPTDPIPKSEVQTGHCYIARDTKNGHIHYEDSVEFEVYLSHQANVYNVNDNVSIVEEDVVDHLIYIREVK